MILARIGLLMIVGLASARAESNSAAANLERSLIERGRYLIKTTGCNDCHTPQYGMKDGNVPEKDWLIGDQVGWRGPWGTTYASNLRNSLGSMTEAEWIRYAKGLRARPPMPWFALQSMTHEDLKSIYHFVQNLGRSSNKVPKGLPPGEVPQTPYINMSVVVPEAPHR